MVQQQTAAAVASSRSDRRARLRAAAAPVVESLEGRQMFDGSVPKVIVISLDGATPHLVEQYLKDGVLPADEGLGLLRSKGVRAERNVTVTPSLTAAGHIAIATGSTAAHNDVVGNSYHLVASPFASNVSGFGAPIGGYDFETGDPHAHDGHDHGDPTAVPVWVPLRAAGKKVVTATWPGGDGVNVTIPGLPNSPIVQPASDRTVDYTVPFGAFAGAGAQGFALTAADFSPAPQATVAALAAAGRASFSPVLQKTTKLETLTIAGKAFDMQAAALDTTDDNATNYDTLVFFDAGTGIRPGPFSLPSTGPAYEREDASSTPFYFEGSSNKAGAAFFVSELAPDLSTVRFARYSANAIPRNAPVLADVDDVNANVGFWAPQPDFRIPERLSPGFGPFPDAELEAMYQDQVRSFVDYQARVGLHGLERVPDADLALIYIEQPDGSGHQFTLTDPRQPTNFRDPNSIGAGQDPAVRERFANYVETAYQVANEAVQRVIEHVGVDANGVPNSNIIVVSDHGMAPFHTAVNMNAYLASKGFDPSKVRAVTSGPAVNVYINLAGREPNGTVTRAEYVSLQRRVAAALAELTDANPNYTDGRPSVKVFDDVYRRPTPRNLSDPRFGLQTSDVIGQDSGDVFALLTPGYNFDGAQNPVVIRKGDPTPPQGQAPVLSVPNFYGAHGYDPELPEMSAIFYAAGPDITKGTLKRVENIDVAPTVSRILGVRPAATVDGDVLPIIKRPSLSIADARATEGNAGRKPLAFTVSLSHKSSSPVTVRFATQGQSAKSGSDYDGRISTLTFAPGETRKSIAIDVFGDRSKEGNETFLVRLSDASGATIADGQAVGTIQNDD